MGDRQSTENTQINEVIGENEKCVFYFVEKTKWTFWPTQSSKELNLKMRLVGDDTRKRPTQLTILNMQYRSILEII